MNTNPQAPKMTAKELAKQVFPLVKQFATDQISARRNRAQDQNQQRRYPFNAANRFMNCLLHPQDLQNKYPLGSGSQQQQHMENYSYQGREHEIRECLRAHNEARRRAPGRSRPDLTWDDRLAIHAKRWAEHLIKHDKFEHDQSTTSEGENMFMVWGNGARHCSFKQAVEAWNEEIEHYRGKAIGLGDYKKYGHYTQNIWPTTTHVGMATATGRNGKQIIVARYSPPGNILGESAYE